MIVKRWLAPTAAVLLTAIVVGVVVFPFLFMVVGSFKNDVEIVRAPLRMIPESPTVQNFTSLFGRIPFWRQFYNSAVVAVSSTVLTLVVCSLVAFGFARYDFRLKDTLFFIVLATMMVPVQLALVPQFQMFLRFGWLNTFYPLILPRMASAFGVFLLRQVMVSIPRDLYDSARIDGCSEFGTYVRIALPLTKSGLGILGLLTFMGAWNDFMTPLIYLSSERMYTLSVGLATLVNLYNVEYGVPMAGALLSALPMLVILNIVGQKYFMQGLTVGAVKG